MRLPPDIPTEVAASLASKEWDVYRLAYGSALAEGDSQPGAAARASAAVGSLRVLAAGGEALVLKYDLDKRFNPAQPRVPRGDPEGGQWTEGTAAAALAEAPEDRASWPAHIRALKVPPAWTDVRYSEDPRADLLAVGRDVKGRAQYVYSARFSEKRAALKFARIRELDDKFEAIEAQNQANQRSDDSEVREHADALALIMETGLRPGSDRDLRAAARAYGATTLEGRHVVRAGRETRLKFVGKKGADLDVPVKDKRVASMLRERARHAGAKGRLFPRTSDASLREYAATLDGGGFRPKDFRTHLGTTIAASEVARLPAPKSPSAYKRAVRGVAKKVAEVLGNTPTVALQSYIDPFVFSRLRAAAGA